MNRKAALAGLLVSALACSVPRRALADGLIRFHNRSFDRGVTVEVRVGPVPDTAPVFGTQRIGKNDDWEVDTSGSVAWWRREQNPGKNDGLFTAWTRADPSHADLRVEV